MVDGQSREQLCIGRVELEHKGVFSLYILKKIHDDDRLLDGHDTISDCNWFITSVMDRSRTSGQKFSGVSSFFMCGDISTPITLRGSVRDLTAR